jgi:hypothetical protein
MPAVSYRAQRANTIPAETPAPWKGLNTVDSLAAMDPAYALSCQNFIATPQGLSVRQGYRNWATNLPAATTSLLAYNGRVASGNKLFAVSGSVIKDITTGGDVSGAGFTVQSGLDSTHPYWQYTHQTYTTGSANYLIAVNGSDFPRIYDGTSWTVCSQTGTPSAPGQFSTVDNNGAGFNIQNFVDVQLHQQRLWFVRDGSSIAYYCPVGQIGGAMKAFDFGPLFPRGGKLMKLATWTLDNGSTSGTSAMLVALSSKGDCVVYTGNDPATAANWQLSGTYQLGSPIGRRCVMPYQGDLWLLTTDGLYALTKYIQSARLDQTQALSYTISPTISDLIATLGGTPGFEMISNPSNDTVLLNIPQANAANNFQFCFNTVTQGWSQFDSWGAQCFAMFNDAFYFGGSNYVALGFIGFKDGADINGNGGNNIISTALSAFSQFSDDTGVGILKHVKMVKPYIVTGQANPTIRIGVNTDFNLVPIIGSATVNPVTGAVWDNAIWDNSGSTWVGSLTTFNQWSTPLSYPGNYLALALSISATSDTLWAATNWIITPGGQFG